jgi:crotonobetainyl-CoA:carnitine CoA-transferase CaiB-like acyl-CoA transferase
MLPLAGVRILAVEQYGAGPFGSMQLADMGAEVIKIENPAEGGDVSRSVGPYFLGDNDSHFFQAFNRNKRSITLNLRASEGQHVLRDLAATADAVLDNLRGDQSPRLGVSYAQLKSANPRIVCAHLSAYGREGARVSWPGYDYLMQAEAGYLSLTGEPDQTPARFGLSIVDMMAGVYAATALLGGIVSARATGVGRDVDVSLFDTALANLNYLAVWFLNGGHAQGREPRASVADAEPALPNRGWLDLHHVQQAEVLAGAVRKGRTAGIVGRSALRQLQGAAGEPCGIDAPFGCGVVGTHDGGMARAFRW